MMPKSMKSFVFAIAAVSLGCAVAPASAQTGYDGVQFVDAVKKKEGDKVMELLRRNGRGIVDARDAHGNTGLIVAITERNQDYTAFLLNQGADPNLAARNGETPLIAAARVGFMGALADLIRMNAKVDAANRMGETALIVAVQQRHVPIVKLLLDFGADPDRADSAAGYSARDYAKRDTRTRELLKLIETKKPKA
jgi:uncharacterized protein